MAFGIALCEQDMINLILSQKIVEPQSGDILHGRAIDSEQGICPNHVANNKELSFARFIRQRDPVCAN